MQDIILDFMKCILDFILFFWFSMQFFSLRWEKKILVSSGLLISFSTVLFFINSLHIPQINTLAALCSSLCFNLILFKGNMAARLLCSVLEVLLIVICEFIPILIYASMVSMNMTAVTNETIQNAGFNLIGTGVFCVVIMTVSCFLRVKKRKEDAIVTITGNLFIIIVPLVSIFIIYYMFYMLGLNGKADSSAEPLSLFIFWGILVMNLAVIWGGNYQKKHYQLQSELDRVSRLEQLDRVVIGQQAAFIEELKGFAHDYTRQIEGIKHLIQDGSGCRKEQAVEKDIWSYTDQMLRHIEDSYRFSFIPSPALRSILCQTQMRCDHNHIRLDTNILYADFSFVDFPDIYSIFENPLENAVEACCDIADSSLQRRIYISITRNKNLVWVEIKNTKENSVNLKNGSILTTKQDASKHGYGLKNIKHVVRRYGGYTNTDYTTDSFTVTIALPVPE